MQQDLRREAHRKGFWHVVIVKSLCWGLQEHTVAPDVMVHRLLKRAVEHLQERRTCMEAELEARTGDMRDPVTEGIEMALIRYSSHVNTMEVRPQPDWRLRQTESAEEEAGEAVDEQMKCLMAHRSKRIQQV